MAPKLQDLVKTGPMHSANQTPRRSLRFRFGAPGAIALALALVFGHSACSSGGSDGTGAAPTTTGGTGNARLLAVEYGRLVDIYGLVDIAGESSVELFENDVMVGPDIQDERSGNSSKADGEILYDFISPNPDNLQPRLLITRDIGSTEFKSAYDALGARLRKITPGLFGQDTTVNPFSVAPRNGVFQLSFAADLGVTDEFFVTKDQNGQVTGLKNTEAVQLLKIVGDPRDGSHQGDFQVIPARVIVKGHRLLIDPVLLGTEGLQYQTRNTASGMPASPDQVGSNIRIAIALEGPLRITDVSEDEGSAYISTNNQAFRSVVRDFRSGNELDDSSDIARGFIRDPEPPRLVGEILTFMEKVEALNAGTQVITVYKNYRNHEIDRGDVLRIVDRASGLVYGTTEVVTDPVDDLGKPEVQHVRVVVRAVPGLLDLDPRKMPGYPSNTTEREEWLRRNAPKVVVVAEFTHSRIDPINGGYYGDDPSNFLSMTPEPLPRLNGDPSDPTENVSPFAGAIIRFTKPVDLSTVRAYDSFFFATRNVLDEDVIKSEFVTPNNIDPLQFNKDKFITPHLVVSRVFDEDGSQTVMRLQPVMGFFLNDEMRPPSNETKGQPLPKFTPYPYFLHLLGGKEGVRDLSGNEIDFQSSQPSQSTKQSITDFLAIPFTLDTRRLPNGEPVFADNEVVNIARRYADVDEDPMPSYYMKDELPTLGGTPTVKTYPVDDVFGAVTYLSNGRLIARPTSRVTKIVDDLNQQPAPPQMLSGGVLEGANDLRWCPWYAGEAQVASNSAGVKFGQGIQNPLNPYGARVMMLWREIDMSLSRVDPYDFNLDVEQMYWAPFTGTAVTYDEFDRVSLFLGASEFRPEPCVGVFNALASLPGSGLQSLFKDNWAYNKKPVTGERDQDVAPHPAYLDRNLLIDPTKSFTEPNGINLYMPLPEFQKPYYVWRDEQSVLQGGNSQKGSDVKNSNQNVDTYIISPYAGGQGRTVYSNAGQVQFARAFWGNFQEYGLQATTRRDSFTGGGLGSIALPLLADFWTYPDDPELPAGNGFLATGFNGWQIALSVQSGAQPNFRAFSGGVAGVLGKPPIHVDPSTPAWTRAAGGYNPNTGNRAGLNADNSVYWLMADFLKRQTVMTNGFVEILNPHRMPQRNYGEGDPRLGPFFVDSAGSTKLPTGVLPNFDWSFEPPLESLPSGTGIVPQFRAASMVDPAPWRWTNLNGARAGSPAKAYYHGEQPTAENFPLNPFIAGDAHMRKYDDRLVNGQARNHWAYYYNRQVTSYTTDINEMMESNFLVNFVGPNETLAPDEVKYFNWRFIMRNNVEATPPVSPSVESFSVTYRFERK